MSTQLIGALGSILIAVGAGAAVWMVGRNPESWLRQAWTRYEDTLDQQFRYLLLEVRGSQVARPQVAILFLLLVVTLITGQPAFLLLAFFTAIGPLAWVQSKRRERITNIEQQLEAWLQLLASSLKASASIGAAIQSTASLIGDPLRQEIDLVIKRTQLGVPLEQALASMAKRTESQTIAGALSAIIIGQRTGGDVPELLDRAARSLREMARLEGLVRAKTAEGKMQAIVLAVAPMAFVAGLHALKHDWFDPLASPAGHIMVGVAVALWIAAVFIASRILKVED